MINLSKLNKEILKEWDKTTANFLFLITEDMNIVDCNRNFNKYIDKFRNIYELITHTHRNQFSSFLSLCIKEQSINSFLTNFSFDDTDVEDIPHSFNITMQYLRKNEIIIIAEPIFPLSHKDAKEYFSMLSDYSNVSRKLQKSEYYLNKKNLELSDKIKELEYLANYDVLTNIFTRRRIFEELSKEYTRTQRLNTSFCMAMLDIDNFKIVNDNYGHESGDFVLSTFSEILKSMCREYDSIGRFGGEEFLLIFPSIDILNAKYILERILKYMNDTKIELLNKKEITVTFSAGLLEVNKGDNIDNLVSSVDSKLYEAKKLGRNRIVI